MSITRRLNRSAEIRAAEAALRGQPQRLVHFLSVNTDALTGAIAGACSIGNVSAAASRANEELEPRGYRIVSRLPKPLSHNQFGEASQQHQWSIERVR